MKNSDIKVFYNISSINNFQRKKTKNRKTNMYFQKTVNKLNLLMMILKAIKKNQNFSEKTFIS